MKDFLRLTSHYPKHSTIFNILTILDLPDTYFCSLWNRRLFFMQQLYSILLRFWAWFVHVADTNFLLIVIENDFRYRLNILTDSGTRRLSTSYCTVTRLWPRYLIWSCLSYHLGTGKTVTGVHIAYWFAQLNKQRKHVLKNDGTTSNASIVFFCGPSNKSVDVVARKCKINQSS